jgi:hypothetical protein
MEKLKNSLWYILGIAIILLVGSSVIYYYWNWFFYDIFELKKIEFKEALIIYLFISFIKLKGEKDDEEPFLNKTIVFTILSIILLIMGYILK